MRFGKLVTDADVPPKEDVDSGKGWVSMAHSEK